VLEFEDSLGSSLEGVVEVFAFLETSNEVQAGSVKSRSSIANAFAAFI